MTYNNLNKLRIWLWLLLTLMSINASVNATNLDTPLDFLLQGKYSNAQILSLLHAKHIYQADLSSLDAIQREWMAEGPIESKVVDKQLHIESAFNDEILQRFEQKKFEFNPNDLSGYFSQLEEIAKDQLSDSEINEYYDRGKFKGGHFVLWNKLKVTDNYMLEVDLQHQSPIGLFILFFSATGMDDTSIFNPTLPKRNGVFSQYTKGAIKSYHISSYTPHRGTANLRKNQGLSTLLKSELDYASLAPDKTYKYRLIKYNNRFQLYLNDQLQMDYIDTLGEQLKGGNIGLRLMAGAKLKVSDFNIYQLEKDPFNRSAKQEVIVRNTQQLNKAVAQAKPGTRVVLIDGEYHDLQLNIDRSGRYNNRIEIVAKTPGQALITGKSAISVIGSHITLSGLKFTDGDRFDNSEFVKNGGNSITRKAPYLVEFLGNYNRLTECEIDDYDLHHGMWISVEGANNRIDHCRFVNKRTHGGIISSSKPPSSGAFHRFDHNYFSRPDINSDNAEIIRLATGWAYNINAFMTVEHNVFENANGEGEVISDKSSRNTIRYNLFKNNLGYLSLRQGSHTHVYGNRFERDKNADRLALKKTKKKSPGFGLMIRVSDHLIENNHFEGYGPELISLSNGQPVGYQKPGRPKELARHHTAAQDVLIRHNTFVPSIRIATIEKRNYLKDRSILAHDITFTNNLVIAQNNILLTSEPSYKGITWLSNGFAGKKIKLGKHISNSNQRVEAWQTKQTFVPSYIATRYGSNISNHSVEQFYKVGPSWKTGL